jgi:hypothetical protein
VALKIVRGGHFVDDQYLRMFRRETETLARLTQAPLQLPSELHARRPSADE